MPKGGPDVGTGASGRRFGLAASFAMMCASVVMSFLVFEAALRILGMDYPRLWEPDSELGWRHVPSARARWTEEGDALVQINRHGYRDVERVVDKQAGRFRIAVFGDSMTEAVQVDLVETFPRRLEKRLSEKGHAAEVLNFGVNGYSPLQELLTLKREGPRYRPDLVVMALFLDNDVSGSHPELSTAPEGPFLDPDNGGHIDYSRARLSYAQYAREPFYSVRRYSASYRALSFSRHRWIELKQAMFQRSEGRVPTRFMLYSTSRQPQWETAWSALEQVLREFAAEADRQGAVPLLVSLPASQVVSDSAWKNLLRQIPGMQKETWDLLGPERRLASISERLGLRLVGLHKQFALNNEGGDLFFGNVGHMTATGHALTAEVLSEFLTSQQLVPRRALDARGIAQ